MALVVVLAIPFFPALSREIPSRYDMLGHLRYAQNIIDSGFIITKGVYGDIYGLRASGQVILAITSILTGFQPFIAVKIYFLFLISLSLTLLLSRVSLSKTPPFYKVLLILLFSIIIPNADITGTKFSYPYLLLLSYSFIKLLKEDSSYILFILMQLSMIAIALTHIVSTYFILIEIIVMLLAITLLSLTHKVSNIGRTKRSKLIISLVLLIIIGFTSEYITMGIATINAFLNIVRAIGNPEEAKFITEYYSGFYELDLFSKIRVILGYLGKDLAILVLTAMICLSILTKLKNNTIMKVFIIAWILISLSLYFGASLFKNVKSRFLIYISSIINVTPDIIFINFNKWISVKGSKKILIFSFMIILAIIASLSVGGLRFQAFIPTKKIENYHVYVIVVDDYISSEVIKLIKYNFYILNLYPNYFFTNYPYILYYVLPPDFHESVREITSSALQFPINTHNRGIILLIKSPYPIAHYIYINEQIENLHLNRVFDS
ncbi:MAG: hypothetical protein QXF79_02925, partial [Ignisphaera sp.]